MSTLEQLLDREAIRDCLYRYCRGIDRVDEQALRSAYWEDAHDRHGAYDGPASGFIDGALSALKSFECSVHQITNILIELAPNSALVESKFLALQRSPAPTGQPAQVLIFGRYADYFEKRQGEWRIARRTVIYDWVEEQPAVLKSINDRFGPRVPVGGRWPDDEIYKQLNSAR
ncbi:hypothetical protein CCOS865_03131 [Pseudomonas reidholzensis]|uniref:SnoaL-like domain-containing protein n=1 Tax=Pseudomonas reidholzensis TaxID=1785162 RepID=A0A383RW34_9PSED|nr:nuclear transport factor 2 family protein [Pseudomonas reidholzensis]SYX90864.1 hypothetical protein CCOS865_03131 [Pseudomonas reidholzensis]